MPQINGRYLFDTIMDCIDSNIGEGEIKSSRKSALHAIVKATTYGIKEIKNFSYLQRAIRLNGTIAKDGCITLSDRLKGIPKSP